MRFQGAGSGPLAFGRYSVPYIKINITIYKFLGYPSFKDELIVGTHTKELITKSMVIELFKKMVAVFRGYNGGRKDDT